MDALPYITGGGAYGSVRATATDLLTGIDGIRSWFTDAHGSADWRAAMTRLLGEDVRAELAA